MNAITRRTALTAPALVALPAFALATPAEPDPVIPAFHAWREAHLENLRAVRVVAQLLDIPPELDGWTRATFDAEAEALEAIALLRPTTAEGVRLFLRAMTYCVGFEMAHTLKEDGGELPEDPLSWTLEDFDVPGDSFGEIGVRGLSRLMEAEALAAHR